MALFDKILVPTDFSPRAETGLNYALELSRRFGSAIHMYNVMRVPYGFASQVAEYKENMNDYAEDWMRNKISEIKNKEGYQDTEITASAGFGKVVTEIIQEADEKDASLIVLSSDGASEGHSYVGSIVSDLIQFSDIPVLTVPYDLNTFEWKDLVFATDYNSGDMEAIRLMADMADVLKSHMHIVHVDQEQELKNEIMFLGFEQKVKETLGTYNFIFEDIYGEDFLDGISQYLENEPCSLLLLVRGKRSSLRKLIDQSVASSLSLQATVPLLTWMGK